jgi:ABC-2 type transport system permease protein
VIVIQTLTRLLAFVGKELVEVVRRPGALISLILGPFLIMALFGLGYQGFRQPLSTILVIPPESGLPTDLGTYQDLTVGMDVRHVVPTVEEAERLLRHREIDVVVVAPPDIADRFRAGEQSVIDVRINRMDPVEQSYAGVLAERLSHEVNRYIVQEAATEGERQAIYQGRPDLAGHIPPEVIAAPTRAELTNVAPAEPGVVSFFGPAVLALILQHMAVTLVALSLVRERTTGIMELFRISPIGTWEVVVGKILAFGVLGAMIAAATIAMLVLVLGVPLLGSGGALVLVIAALLVASLGLGLLIGVVSDSERQAVQLSLLVLLASVFFSGFVLNIEEFTPEVRTAAYVLPVTHGIRLIQDVMLHGWTNALWHLWALGGIAIVLVALSWALLRRSMTRT